MFFQLFLEQVGVSRRMESHESGSKAGRKVGDGFLDSTFGTGDLGGVSRKEVVHSLIRRETSYWWQYTKGVTCQKDEVLGVTGLLFSVVVGDVKDGVRHTAILRNRHVEIVRRAVLVDLDVLKQRILANCAVDIGFRIFGEVNRLCVATSFKIENSRLVPGSEMFK